MLQPMGCERDNGGVTSVRDHACRRTVRKRRVDDSARQLVHITAQGHNSTESFQTHQRACNTMTKLWEAPHTVHVLVAALRCSEKEALALDKGCAHRDGVHVLDSKRGLGTLANRHLGHNANTFSVRGGPHKATKHVHASATAHLQQVSQL